VLLNSKFARTAYCRAVEDVHRPDGAQSLLAAFRDHLRGQIPNSGMR
jgi:hypothetical protein